MEITGNSMDTNADADPLVKRDVVANMATTYLQGAPWHTMKSCNERTSGSRARRARSIVQRHDALHERKLREPSKLREVVSLGLEVAAEVARPRGT